MPLVSFVDKLMSASNELQTVDVVEFSSYLIAEEPTSTTWTDGPSFHIFGVAPNEIAKGTFVRDFLSTSNNTYLIESTYFGTKTTVNTKYSAIYKSCEREKIEDLTGSFPDGRITIFLMTFFIEAIDLCDLT